MSPQVRCLSPDTHVKKILKLPAEIENKNENVSNNSSPRKVQFV